MSSLDFHTSPTSALPEKFRALGSKVRDPLARSGPSFDGAGDVKQEFYCGDDSDSDEGAGSPEADHPFSGPRSFRKSGFSLTAISEEDEDEDEDEDEEEGEEDTTATDSTDARGLLDTDHMFSSSRTTRAHRRYRVASVPSLWAIKEEDEDSNGDESLSDANTPVSTSDLFRSSLTCVVADAAEEEGRGLAADDSDSGWVWIGPGGLDKAARWAPVSSMRARPRRSRLRVLSWLKALCGAGLRGSRTSLRR